MEGVEVKAVWSGLEGLFAPGARSNDAGLACFPAPATEVFAEGLGWDLGAVIPSAPPYPDLRVAPVCHRKVTVDWGAAAGVVNATYARVQLRGGFGVAARLGPDDPEDGEPRGLPCVTLAARVSEARGWSVEPAVVPAGTEDIHLWVVESANRPADVPGRLPADVAAVLAPGTGELAVAAAAGSQPGTLWKVDGAEAILLGPPGRREAGRAVWAALAPGAYVLLGHDSVALGPFSLDEGEHRDVQPVSMADGVPRSFGSDGLGGGPAAVVTCPGRQQFVPFVQPTLTLPVGEDCTVTLCGSTAGCAVDADGRCAPDSALACPNGVDVQGHQVGDREPR